jgi:hypothetical protein
MGYVKESQRNTAWYLFNKLFYVRVNPLKVRSVEEIKLYGTLTTGNEEVDREMAKNETVVMLHIAQMEDMFNRGYTVAIVKYEDTKTIYQLITNHLIAMRNVMTLSENVTNDVKTLDELIRLDKFAEAIFGHARYQMKSDTPHSKMAQRFSSDRFSGLSKLGRQRRTEAAAAPSATAGGMGRDYGVGQDAPRPDPLREPEMMEVKDDPNLPKRVSLERLFEHQKREGMNWGGGS